jgi:hypothetical protein
LRGGRAAANEEYERPECDTTNAHAITTKHKGSPGCEVL